MGWTLNVWCHVCCSRHGDAEVCPGELEATGTEVRSWRVNVNAGRRVEAFGVLLAPSGDLWRARIFTYPGALWVVPGGNASIKFVGKTADAAQQQAIRFIRDYCKHRGYRIRGDNIEIESANESEVRPCAGIENRRSPRTVCFHRVWFGARKPVEVGETGDLSESGLYIITEHPLELGSSVSILIELADRELRVSGVVRWSRKKHHRGRAPGMGIQLGEATDEYLRFVRSLS